MGNDMKTAMAHQAIKDKWDKLCTEQAEDWLALSVCNSAQAMCAVRFDTAGRDRAALEGEKIYGRICGRNKDCQNLLEALSAMVEEEQDPGGIAVATLDGAGGIKTLEGAALARHQRLMVEHGRAAVAQILGGNGGLETLS